MSQQTWQETLVSNVTVGPTVTAVTITSMLPTDSVFTLPANYLTLGKKIRLTAAGQTTTTVTTPGTKIVTVNLGAIAVFVSPTMALNIVAGTYSWQLDLLLTCTAVGSGTSAKLRGIGKYTSDALVGAAAPTSGGVTTFMLPNTAPVDGNGFASVTAGAIDLLVTNSVNDSEILHYYTLESLN